MRFSTKIISRKFDGSINRRWEAEFVGQSDERLTFVGVFEKDVDHPELGFIDRGTVSYEYYWLDRWYNVFRFHRPDGTLRNWYCNVNLPPTYAGDVLDYIDLDLDLLVWPDLRTEILDRDDFERNAESYDYPESVRAGAENALDELRSMIIGRRFPFELNYGSEDTTDE